MTILSTKKIKLLFSIILFTLSLSFAGNASAFTVLLPGNINSCGELATAGTYTLTTNVSGGTDTCFDISANGVTIDGGDFTITGTGTTSPAIDARKRGAGPGSSLTDGANSYTNLLITATNISGYEVGVNISGNDSSTDFAGDAGDIEVFYSDIGDIVANGGDTTTEEFGGSGGSITFTDTDLDISNDTFSTLGGSGTTGDNTDGGVDLNYSGTLTRTGVSFSEMEFFNDNTTEYGVYPGGGWPLTPGDISTCGVLGSEGVYTLSDNITSDGCFRLVTGSTTIDFNTYTIDVLDASTTDYVIEAGSNATTTIINPNVTGFINLINSDSSVYITGENIDISNLHIVADELYIIDTGTTTYASTTISSLSKLVIGEKTYTSVPEGLLSNIISGSGEWTVLTGPGLGYWEDIEAGINGNVLAVNVDDNYLHTSSDSGISWNENINLGQNEWAVFDSTSDSKNISVFGYDTAYIFRKVGRIRSSNNLGTSWFSNNERIQWNSLSYSGSGQKIYSTTASNDYVYVSENKGRSFFKLENSFAKNYKDIAVSQNGEVVVAVTSSNDYIYLSEDGGNSWSSSTSPGNNNWESVSLSKDGGTILVGTSNDYLYKTTDKGSSWATTSLGQANWFAVDMSLDGSVMIAASSSSDYVYISNNSGNAWIQQTDLGQRYWGGVSVSPDGNKFYSAASSNGYIYNYSNPNPTNRIGIISPESSISKWYPIISWSISETCEYSYDNSNWTTVDCSSGGNDISAPSDYGTSTLYVRGTDGNSNVDTDSIEFDYTFKPQILSPYTNNTYNTTTFYSEVDWDQDDLTNNFSGWTCEYSYDNSNWTTVDCSNNGSDIEISDSTGTSTLYARVSDDNSNVGVETRDYIYANHSSFKIDHIFDEENISSDGSIILSEGPWPGYKKYISRDYGANFEEIEIKTSNDYFTTYDNDHVITKDGKKIFSSEERFTDALFKGVDPDGDNIYSNVNIFDPEGFNIQDFDTSSDGRVIVVATREIGTNDWVRFVSKDGGLNWNEDRSYTSLYGDVEVSDDGSTIVVWRNFQAAVISHDSGDTWFTSSGMGGTRTWEDVAISGDGQKILFIQRSYYYNGLVYMSTNGGVSFSSLNSAGRSEWRSIDISFDGEIIYVGQESNSSQTSDIGRLKVSKNGGASWTDHNIDYLGDLTWDNTTISADGNTAYSKVENDVFYNYNDPNPRNSAEILNIIPDSSIVYWDPLVVWSISETCEYSYDNSNWTTVDCSNNGSDIGRPTSSGTSTLYIKGLNTDIGTSTSSVTFEYYPSYWCGTEDNDWNNGDNWYSNDDCELVNQTGTTPTAITDTLLFGSVSPIITSTTTLPINIDTNGLTGSASSTGVIFSDSVENTVPVIGNATFNDSSYNNSIVSGNATFNDSSYNTGTVSGNATFNDSSYNTGTISGNAIFTNGSGGALTLGGSQIWGGTISGTVKGGDDVDIDFDQLTFEDDSQNLSSITGNPTFEDGASNNGTITGNPTFNNTEEFTIGTVVGDVTLEGTNQIISGINSVTNFFKQLVGGVDTLFFRPDSVFNVSGLFTLLGADSNNLLSIESTTPGSSYDLGIDGTFNFDFLRLKDANNTGSSIDLSDSVIYNDGGNSGFNFGSSATPGTRSFSSINNSTPSAPSSRGGGVTQTSATGGGGSNSGVNEFGVIVNQVDPIDFTDIQQFTPFSPGNFIPQQVGTTVIPGPFDNFQAPNQFGFITLPNNFSLNISNFLFAGLPQTISNAIDSVPSVPGILASIGSSLSNSQYVARIGSNPILINEEIQIDEKGLFIVNDQFGNKKNTYLTATENSQNLSQLVKVRSSDLILVKLDPLSNGEIIAEYQGVSVPFNINSEGIGELEVKVPEASGRYILTTNSTPLTLIIEVFEPVKVQEQKYRKALIPWLYRLIFGR